MEELSILQIAFFLFILGLLLVFLIKLALVWSSVRNKMRGLIESNKYRNKSWKQLGVNKSLGLSFVFGFCTVVSGGLGVYFLNFTKNFNLAFYLLAICLVFTNIAYKLEKGLLKKIEKIKF